MPLFSECLVADGAGPWVSTLNGVDLTLGNTISIKLTNPTGVGTWYLEIVGTDELSSPPFLVNVNPITHEVLSPAAIVTFMAPVFRGRAILFRSTVRLYYFRHLDIHDLYADLQGVVGGGRGNSEGNQSYGWARLSTPS